MRLYQVELDNVGYGTFDGCIVVADSEKEVYKYITAKDTKKEYSFFIEKYQMSKITEIKLDEYKRTTILFASFNAGLEAGIGKLRYCCTCKKWKECKVVSMYGICADWEIKEK